MISPRFSFQGTLPSALNSFLISVGAIVFAIVSLYLLKLVFPQANFDDVVAAIITAASGFIINTVRLYVQEK